MKQYSSCNKKAFAVLNSITAIISIQPVFAVDYVACREMLRTKNEMLENAEKAEVKFYGDERDKFCDWDKFKLDNIKYDIRAQADCKDNFGSTYQKMKNKIIGKNAYYTEEGYKWGVSAEKVKKDMKKASCPYE